MKLKLAALVVAGAIGYPVISQALGLGNVKLHSALNEPLKADIGLRSVASGEADGVKVSLAGTDEFARLGIERPYQLSQLQFKVVQESSGRTYIRVTTTAPVREPFLNFLVEVNWPQGRLLREYTVLLDPPVYGAAASMGVQGPVVKALEQAPSVQTTQIPAQPTPPVYSGSIGPSDATDNYIGPSYTGDSYGPVSASDTLWSIASQVRPSGVSNQQMMLALLRSNPEAFVNGNINRLRKGYVLQIPSADEARQLSQAEALQQVRAQQEDWQGFVQSVAAAPAAPMVSGESRQPSVTDTGPMAPDQAELKIVGTGASTGGGSGSTDVEDLSNRLTTAEEALDSVRRENQDLSDKLNIADDIIRDLRRAVELRDNELAALQEQGETAAVGEESVTPAEPEMDTGTAEIMVEETVREKPVEPPQPVIRPEAERKPVPRPTPVLPKPSKPKEESLLDTVKSLLPFDPVILGAGAGGLLALILGGVFVARKRKNKAEPATGIAATADDYLKDEDLLEPFTGSGAETRELSSDAIQSGDEPTQDAPQVAAEEETIIEEPKDDPLAEVNVYLAYERFDQAEELVEKAIAEHPDRPEYLLKLLEIHHAGKNVSGFQASAVKFRDAFGVDHTMMGQIQEWWNELAPDSGLFDDQADTQDLLASTQTGLDSEDLVAGATVAGAAAAAAAATDDSELDFDLGLTGEGEEDGGVDFDLELEGEAEDSALDLDLTGDEPTELPPEEAAEGLDLELGGEGEETSIDLDLGGGEGGEEASIDLDLGDGEADSEAGVDLELDIGEEATDLDFDLGGLETTDPDADITDVPAAERAEPEDDAGLDFDLGDLDTGDSEQKQADDSVDLDLGLELSDTDGDAAHVMDTLAESGALDMGADETEADAGSSEPESATEESVDLDLGSLDTEAPAESSEIDATDLDFDLDAGAGEDSAVDLDLEMGLDSDAGEEEAPSIDLDIGGEEADGTEATDLDFDLGTDLDSTAGADSDDEVDLDLNLEAEAEENAEEMPSIDFDLDIDEEENEKTLALGREMDGDIDEIGTKLDLAQAYVDMGDTEGAKGILGEVMEEGDETQKQDAQALLDKIS